MENTKECHNECPNCGATGQDLDWHGSDTCDDYMVYAGLCKKCNCEFDEIHSIVYDHTEYDVPVEKVEEIPDNPYSLYMSGVSERDLKRAKEVEEKITEIIDEMVDKIVAGVSTHSLMVNYSIYLNLLDYAGVGVGDTETDNCIVEIFKDKLMERGVTKNKAEKLSHKLYDKIHC